jgi:hypothetical protein
LTRHTISIHAAARQTGAGVVENLILLRRRIGVFTVQ